MSWSLWVPILTATALLLLQGSSYLILKDDRPYTRCAGGVTILLAALGLLFSFLLATGALILGPEFGIVMVQGAGARFGFACLTTGTFVAAGLEWHMSRCARGLASHRWWILPLSVGVGVAALLRMQVLNQDDPLSIRIACYDFWWPISLIWLSVCLSESTMLRFSGAGRWTRLWAATLLPTALGLWAVHRSHLQIPYASPDAPTLWRLCLIAALPANIALGALLGVDRLTRWSPASRRLLGISVAGLLGAVAFLSAWLWCSHFAFALPAMFRPWSVGLCFLVLLALTVGKGGYRFLRTARLRLSTIIVLILVVGTAATLADMVNFGWLTPVWDLTALLLLGITLLEIVGRGPLRALARWPAVRDIISADLPLLAFAKAVYRWLPKLAQGIVGSLRTIFRASTWPVALLKAFAALLLLIALAEVPDAGKTVIVPFSTVGLSAPEKEKDLGRIVSDRIANTVGLLGQEMQPDMLTLRTEATHGSGKTGSFQVVVRAQETEAIRATAKTGSFEVPGTGVEIPLSILAAPIQSPIRRLLKMRVIQGSIQREGGHYVVLAGSTKGETWRAPGDSAGLPWRGDLPAPPAPSADAQQPLDELMNLADEIAYKAVSTDDGLLGLGITPSWRAISSFREARELFRRYEVAEDFAALSQSIERSSEAVS